ncbi:hypothetical protein PIB30_072639 [Stylosanthes scabra]|uniref:RING-type domain-containing protein n=1 Tax=Stylosanthes scabra TaxID=79078 RepID=A0ABU6TPW2_9FABA|nr:hypothetical protein [Stylosanthes scabra]
MEFVLPPPFIFLILFLSLTVTSTFTKDTNLILFLSLMASLFIYVCLNYVASLLKTHIDERNRVRDAATLSEPEEPMQTGYRIERLMAHQREYVDYSRLQQHTGLQHNYDYAKISIVRKALRVLPPVKSFVVEDKSNGCPDMIECSICMEVFKDGELVQPLGLCSHQFHSSCLYSWLHSGKSTCPLCRVDLATA